MSSKLNGSVQRLAEALSDVIREGVDSAIQPLESRLNARIDSVKNDLHQEVQEAEERLSNSIDRGIEKITAEQQVERSAS